jgi:PKD repeat protein
MKTTLLILSLLSVTIISAQYILLPEKSKTLNINNIQTDVNNSSNFLIDRINNRPPYGPSDDDSVFVIYSANIVISSKDTNQIIRSSGQYFQKGEFYPGPIEFNQFLEEEIAEEYDRIWMLYRWEVKEFIQKFGQSGYIIPKDILDYPAHNNDGTHFYFPFRDVNGDGLYNALHGDYPEYNLDGSIGCDEPKLFGDQTLIWIMNDKGGQDNLYNNPMGINVFCQAFAYQGSESINNATMYEYRIENQSTNQYDSLYFTLMMDYDIGCSDDDAIGSDVSRGLGYGYNGSPTDVGQNNPCLFPIGSNPPAVGVDFLKGPIVGFNDGLDNDRNGHVDELNERYSMSSHLYFAGWMPAGYGSDNNAYDDFRVAKGLFANGDSLRHPIENYTSTYAFPDSSDTLHWFSSNGYVPNSYWSFTSSGTPTGDMRSLPSLGAMILLPHESKSIIMAIPYAKDYSGDNLSSVIKLKAADDTLQMLADNCFDVGCQPFQEGIFVDKISEDEVHFAYAQDADNYSWDFGDGATGSGQFPVHTYNAPGTYSVCVTVISACSNLTTCEDVIISTDMLNLGTVDIIRIEGEGNGGNQLILKQSSIDQMFAQDSNRIYQPVYEGNYAPIKVEVVDITMIQSGDYQIAFDGVDSLSGWKMYQIGGTDTVSSNMSLKTNNRQIIYQWGVAVTVNFDEYSGDSENATKFLSQNKSNELPYNDWLSGVEDRDVATPQNWIRSGTQFDTTGFAKFYIDRIGYDNDEVFENVFDGTIAPFGLIATGEGQLLQPVYASIFGQNGTKNASSIRLVYTNDQTKWTRSPVLETSFDPSSNPYGDEYLRIKHAPSKDKFGNNESTSTGMSWFPGYAIDVETGERLNIAFGEASDLLNDNGNDMWFNPTNVEYDTAGNEVFGGKHYVFVFGNYSKRQSNAISMATNQGYYDEGAWLASMLNQPFSTSNFLKIWRSCTWVTTPMLRLNNNFLANDVILDIRNAHPHQKYSYAFTDTLNNGNPLYQFALYPSVSVEEQIVSINHTTYPNPTNDIFTIIVEDNKEYQILIFNTSGQIVKTVNIYNGKETIDMSNQADGLYHYYIYSEDGGMFGSGKIIKQ